MKNQLKIMSLILSVLCAFSLTACNMEEGITIESRNDSNPHEAQWLTAEMAESLDSLKRVDTDGVMYEMNYTADYYDATITDVVKKAAGIQGAGCSAFSTYNTDGDFLTCRNYDYRHKNKDGEYTGLQVVIHSAPEGKLKSIGVCDAFWLNTEEYIAGSLDDGVTDTSLVMLAPYMCVDGFNEAGLTASLLLVDTKDGETPTNQDTGKEKATHSMLLRYIIDNAHNVEEAIKIAEQYDVYSASNTDLHIYIGDKDGNSAVFEWRQYDGEEEQTLHVTYTNAVTNFLVGFDDGEDAYREDGSLKEICSKLSPTFNNYKYGYGHGYHRFNQIVSSLERYIQDGANEHGIRNSEMMEDQALDILRVISQDPGTEATSFTQFSAIYNLEKCSVSYWVQRDYGQEYTFAID